MCIISGLAIGIDTAAHLGSVHEIGNTIAVLAGGLDHVYPKENNNLFNKILENGGCIISEHSDDTETNMRYFTKRNRIISGIADGVIVAECRLKSGSASTATYAFSQEKTVYCIPRSIDSSFGLGINELINRGAKVAMSPNQIINDLYCNKQLKLDLTDLKSSYENYRATESRENILQTTEKNESKNIRNIKEIPKEYREIYKVLIKKNLTSDEISRSINMDIAELNYKLTLMEIEKYIIRKERNIFSINV